MSQLKPLNIGVIGYGFMGRTHSNGYKRVNDFFPELGHRPVLKAICGRSEEQLRKFAGQWQYESTETDWRRLLDRTDGNVSAAARVAGVHRKSAEYIHKKLGLDG